MPMRIYSRPVCNSPLRYDFRPYVIIATNKYICVSACPTMRFLSHKQNGYPLWETPPNYGRSLLIGDAFSSKEAYRSIYVRSIP